jgi:hypothetical protein
MSSHGISTGTAPACFAALVRWHWCRLGRYHVTQELLCAAAVRKHVTCGSGCCRRDVLQVAAQLLFCKCLLRCKCRASCVPLHAIHIAPRPVQHHSIRTYAYSYSLVLYMLLRPLCVI